MNIAIVAGGTLGHIMPGLVLAKKLSEKHNVIYITSLKDKRFSVLNESEFLKKVYYVDSRGFTKNAMKNIVTLTKAICARTHILKILKEERIDLVIGMGGYISGIAMLCKLKTCKKIIHEQNKIMGFANKVSLKYADKILLTFDIDLKERFNNKKCVVSNPVLFSNEGKCAKKQNKIIITSGSNGAKEVNDIAIELINNHYLDNYDITLVTGKKYYENVKKEISNNSVKILPFSNNLIDELKDATYVISRAGSSTIFEALSTNTIPILIPSKNVKDNHQYFNALEIKRMNLGEIVESVDDIVKIINRIKRNYKEYISNINNYKKLHSMNKIINIIEGKD